MKKHISMYIYTCIFRTYIYIYYRCLYMEPEVLATVISDARRGAPWDACIEFKTIKKKKKRHNYLRRVFGTRYSVLGTRYTHLRGADFLCALALSLDNRDLPNGSTVSSFSQQQDRIGQDRTGRSAGGGGGEEGGGGGRIKNVYILRLFIFI